MYLKLGAEEAGNSHMPADVKQKSQQKPTPSNQRTRKGAVYQKLNQIKTKF